MVLSLEGMYTALIVMLCRAVRVMRASKRCWFDLWGLHLLIAYSTD